MTRQHDIRYINSYVSGNVAYQMETKPEKPKKSARLPKPRKQQMTVIQVEPVAILGIATAVVLLVMMAVGWFQLLQARQETVAMQNYVQMLEQQNQELKDTYHAGYDLEEIEKTALAMGMVPKDQVTHIQVPLAVPPAQPQQTYTVWEKLWIFLTGLFA